MPTHSSSLAAAIAGQKTSSVGEEKKKKERTRGFLYEKGGLGRENRKRNRKEE